MTLESTIGADEFMLYIDGMDAFVNKEVPSQEEEDVCKEPYQILPESPDIDDVVYQENSEKSVDIYDQFVGVEVCIPDG